MSILSALRTDADASVMIDDHAQINGRFRYWRARILTITIVGYALYYFVRTNIGVPLKSMGGELGYSKEQLGVILTVGGVTYGVSKFINGFLGDHANPRFFMAIGLLGSALMNVCFGLSSSLAFFSGFWFFNNYFQGMGFPPCAKSMAHWFSPRERSSTFGIWHISHMVGAATIVALTGQIVTHFGWRWCFYIPAGIAVIGAILILIFLRDTPGSLGLPTVEEWDAGKGGHGFPVKSEPTGFAEQHGSTGPKLAAGMTAAEERAAGISTAAAEEMTYWQVVVKYIFKSPYMWIISFANLVVYVLRYVGLNWGPTLLQESKGLSVGVSATLVSGFELGGLVGALGAGFVADRVFGGRAGRVCVIAMGSLVATIYLFWIAPKGSAWIVAPLYIILGFFIYIPQMLIAAMAMNLGTKRASAAAVGLTGIIGYLSTIVSGWGVGKVVDLHGWDGAIELMIGCAVATLVLMAFTWNVGAHPKTGQSER